MLQNPRIREVECHGFEFSDAQLLLQSENRV